MPRKQNETHCPNCGGIIRETTTTDPLELFYHWVCPHCGTVGETVYAEHCIIYMVQRDVEVEVHG